MKLTEKFSNFLNSIFSSSEAEEIDTESTNTEESVQESSIEEIEEEKSDITDRTVKTKLYLLEQEIAILEIDYRSKHKMFMEKIEKIRERYNSNLQESNKALTFTINPEQDLFIKRDISMLEDEIRYFIEKQVKFDIISKRIQKLILKLNILYNVSIFHCKEDEKQKAISQVEHAIEVEKKIIAELKSNKYIFNDKQLRDRIVSFISYLDYEIFKIIVRNSNRFPDELAIVSEFYGFDYVSDFSAFIKDEITDLSELLPLIKNDEYQNLFNQKLLKLLTQFVSSNDDESKIMNITFWNNFLSLESNLLKFLKSSGIEKAKIKLIGRINIGSDESEVLEVPKDYACLALKSLFSETHDKKLLILLKVIENLSDEITYKEIYFLLLVFDTIEIIKNMPNELFKYIEKYIEKYPYNSESIREKKKIVMNLPNRDYVIGFCLDT